MKFYTHIAAAIILYLLIFKLLHLPMTLATAAVSLLASLMPDIDTPGSIAGRLFHPLSTILKSVFGHRGITHSFPALILSTIVLFNYSSELVTLSFLLGYLSHIFLDMLSGGVRLFYPFKRRYKLIKNGIKEGEETVFAFLLFLLAFILVRGSN